MTQLLNVHQDMQQVKTYQQASKRLLAAVQLHSEAKAASDRARDAYEDARRELVVRGMQFKERASAEEKEAVLCNALRVELLSVRAARNALRLAEIELEAARIVERSERETLRSRQRDYEFQKPVAS